MKLAAFLLPFVAMIANADSGIIRDYADVTITKLSCEGLLSAAARFPLSPEHKVVRYNGVNQRLNVRVAIRLRGELAQATRPSTPSGEDYVFVYGQETKVAYPGDGHSFTLDFGINARSIPYVIFEMTSKTSKGVSHKKYSVPVRFVEGDWNAFQRGERVKVELTEEGLELRDEQLEGTLKTTAAAVRSQLTESIGKDVRQNGYVGFTMLNQEAVGSETQVGFEFEGKKLRYTSNEEKALLVYETILIGAPSRRSLRSSDE